MLQLSLKIFYLSLSLSNCIVAVILFLLFKFILQILALPYHFPLPTSKKVSLIYTIIYPLQLNSLTLYLGLSQSQGRKVGRQVFLLFLPQNYLTYSHSPSLSLSYPLYQCDQVWLNLAILQYFKSLGQFCLGLFSVWQNLKPSLAIILCYWVNFDRCKQPNIEKIIQPSRHTAASCLYLISLSLYLIRSSSVGQFDISLAHVLVVLSLFDDVGVGDVVADAVQPFPVQRWTPQT